MTSGVSCLAIPYGTLLGVFRFIVLGRPSVKTLFDVQSQTEITASPGL
ncbi:MAG: hypothetical protein ACRER1_03210 [Gammaproteobacteria bacterium]